MKKKIVAVTVSTMEALADCVETEIPLIYMDWFFFVGSRIGILGVLKTNGYSRKDFRARKGVFFGKGIEVKEYSVLDPYRLY